MKRTSPATRLRSRVAQGFQIPHQDLEAYAREPMIKNNLKNVPGKNLILPHVLIYNYIDRSKRK
jgi:hypothetical protein